MTTELIRFAIITLSDRAATGQCPDESGPLLKKILTEKLNAHCITAEILPDDQQMLEKKLIELCDNPCNLIITTGSTGLAPRDIAPDATLNVIDRQIPGIAEAIRAAGLAHTPLAMLSRAVCGLRKKTIIINLSGSPKAVHEQLDVILPILPHALAVTSGKPQNCAR
jgi:molybdopterin adenylyltransferase